MGHRCPQQGRSPHPSHSPHCCSGGAELGILALVWAFIKNSTLIKFSLSLRRAWLALIKAGLLLRADKPLVGRMRAGKAPVVSGTCHPVCRPWLPSCGEGEGIKQLLENVAGKAALGMSRLASFLTIITAGWGVRWSPGRESSGQGCIFILFFPRNNPWQHRRSGMCWHRK